jgi:hypothetical protein
MRWPLRSLRILRPSDGGGVALVNLTIIVVAGEHDDPVKIDKLTQRLKTSGDALGKAVSAASPPKPT